MTDRELMQMALCGLERVGENARCFSQRESIRRLRERLNQPEPEPVAWLFQNEETGLTECVDIQQVEWGFEKNNPRWQKIAPLYTAPPKREWVWLTDVEIADIEDEELTLINTETFSFAKAIEAKLKEKNT